MPGLNISNHTLHRTAAKHTATKPTRGELGWAMRPPTIFNRPIHVLLENRHILLEVFLIKGIINEFKILVPVNPNRSIFHLCISRHCTFMIKHIVYHKINFLRLCSLSYLRHLLYKTLKSQKRNRSTFGNWTFLKCPK